LKPCDAIKKVQVRACTPRFHNDKKKKLSCQSLQKNISKKVNKFLAGKKPVFLKLLHLSIISDSCLRHFQSPAVMSLITEKDVHGLSAVHYAAKKGDIKV